MPDKKTSRRVEPKPDWDAPSRAPGFEGATPKALARALLRKVDEREEAVGRQRQERHA